MKNLSILIKPASSGCNINCKYCFYNDVSNHRKQHNYGLMTLEMVDLLVDRLKEIKSLNGLHISFQGGEPTIIGLSFYKSFIEKIKQLGLSCSYSIQTNGLLINEKWASFFKENNFLVGVSIDGFKENMDVFRVDFDGNSIYEKCLACLELLKKYGVDFNVLTVLTNNLAANPNELFKFYQENQIQYVQLIPCLPSIETSVESFALNPESYYKFYSEFFKIWLTNLQMFPISVNLFENIVCLLLNKTPYQCGLLGKCPVHFILESNGNVYPCDFYCTDECLLGNIKDSSILKLLTNKKARDFVNESYCQKKPCQNCKYINICHGGCKRQNICYLNDDFCAHKKMLDEILPELIKLI